MSQVMVPRTDREQLITGYAGALGQVSQALSNAPGAIPPREVKFTQAVERDQTVSARILVRWVAGARRLCLEFDAEGIVDYWSEPDFGPLKLDDESRVFASLMEWLDGPRGVAS